LPAAVNSYAGMSKKDKAAAVAMNKWVKMVDDYWKQEPTGMGIGRVQLVVIENDTDIAEHTPQLRRQ
jgi:hypothetical protein